MEETRLMLLIQLIENLAENSKSFEDSLFNADKEKFEDSKKSLLEVRGKINVLIKNLT